MMKIFKYAIVKSIMNSVRNLAMEEQYDYRKDVLRNKLGFDSIEDYMKASPEEIRYRQNLNKDRA